MRLGQRLQFFAKFQGSCMKKLFAATKISLAGVSLALTVAGLVACSDEPGSTQPVISEAPESSSEVGFIGFSSSSIEYIAGSSSSAVVENPVSSSSVTVKSSSSSKPLTVLSSSSRKEISDSKVVENAYGIRGGFFNSGVDLPVPQAANGATLHCTFDGSEPTPQSEPLTSNRRIDANTVVRCVGVKNGTPVDTLTESFFINENVRMPVVSISVSPEFFTRNYVYNSYCAGQNPASCSAGLMEEKEYPVHVEYFANGSSSQSKAWEINAGISLMGHWSRTYAKKSVSISMREQYQDGRLRYPLFETRPNDKKFKAFNLRNNGNRFVSDYFEDPMAGSLLEGTGVDYQRSRQVVVFYNGKYYGIHDLREKMNEHFVETNYGYDSKTVDVIKHVADEITASGGTVDNYNQMMQFIASSDFSGTNNANYEKVKTMMDVGNFADYMAAQIYFKNGDWPNNNVRAWRSPEQPWKFMIFDLDHGFGWDWAVEGFDSNPTMFNWIMQGGRPSGNDPNPCHENASAKCFHTIFVKLIKNDDFKRLLANHAAILYTNYLNQSKVSAAVSRIRQTLDDSEISRDMSAFPREFGLNFDPSGSSFASWAGQRDGAVWNEFQSSLGLSSPITVSIKSNGRGIVLVDGMKLPGSSSSTNYSGKFFGGNKIELTALPMEGAMFAGWSDGVMENPRIVSPENGASYTANFL